MDDHSRSNGPTGPTDWNAVDWRRANRVVRNLRQRIFRAARENDLKTVRSLQKLMLRSWSNLVLGVRRATQQNRGKNTPGVDKVRSWPYDNAGSAPSVVTTCSTGRSCTATTGSPGRTAATPPRTTSSCCTCTAINKSISGTEARCRFVIGTSRVR